MALPLGNAEYPFTSLYYIFGSFYVSMFLCILWLAKPLGRLQLDLQKLKHKSQ